MSEREKALKAMLKTLETLAKLLDELDTTVARMEKALEE